MNILAWHVHGSWATDVLDRLLTGGDAVPGDVSLAGVHDGHPGGHPDGAAAVAAPMGRS